MHVGEFCIISEMQDGWMYFTPTVNNGGLIVANVLLSDDFHIVEFLCEILSNFPVDGYRVKTEWSVTAFISLKYLS